MTKGNNIVFFLIIAAFFLVVAKVSAHPFHVSVSEIRIDTKKATLDISCRIFTDDLEGALEKKYSQKFDLENSTNDKNIQRLFDEYFQAKFSIGNAGTMQVLSFIGMEKEDDAMWFYYESTNFKTLGSLTVTNALLYDFISDQINIIHLYVDEQRQSVRLVNPESAAGFRF